MRNLFAYKVAFAVLFGLAGVSAHAQSCAAGYDRLDRRAVIAQDVQAQLILERMAAVAELSANGVFSNTQRLALLNEFSALRNYLGTFGDSVRPGLSARSNQFLADVMDINYLGIADITVIGATNGESQENSRLAIDTINNAMTMLKTCLWGSWERRVIVGSPNDGMCAGGYSRGDLQIVGRQFVAARTIMNKMSAVAQTAADGVFSTSQRNLLNFDFEYLKEDLDILGSRIRPRATALTNHFLSTVIDPIYLGLSAATLSGPTIFDAQNNARASLAAIRSGQATLAGCAFPRLRLR